MTIEKLVKLQALVVTLVGVFLFPLFVLFACVITSWSCIWNFVFPSRKRLDGEVALVTGAAHGLGRALALELAKLGCHIAVVDIDLPGAKETVKQISQISKVDAKAYKANVASYTEIVELNTNIKKDLGPVTVLINNAGLLLLNNALEPHPADVQRMIDVNMTSHFWTKDIFLPTMKKLRRGHIVTISSISSIWHLPYNSTYTATKFAATGHMRALRLELAIEQLHDIHVTTVMPWFLKTNDEVAEMATNIYLNRIYPLFSGEAVARRTVQGMLRGEREIFLPGIFAICYRAMGLLPLSWQDKIMILVGEKMFHKFTELCSGKDK